MASIDIDFRKVRVGAILNTASGSCDETSEQKVRDLLQKSGVKEPKIWAGDASTMGRAFSEAKTYDPDVLIVLGGDGTIRKGAESCGSDRPLLIPLPGGTMNMLPKALYGEALWEEALQTTLRFPRVKSVSGGAIQGHQFFVAAIAGAPALWAKVREALRDGDLESVVDEGVHAFQKMLATKIRYSLGENALEEADALAIVCPLISDSMEDTEQSLEATAIDVEDAVGVMGLASNAAFGRWSEDRQVSITKAQTITISADEEIPIILDGESMEFGKELQINFVPKAFSVLVPKNI